MFCLLSVVQRKTRTRTIPYDRNVCINRPVKRSLDDSDNEQEQKANTSMAFQRTSSKRVSVPVKKFNFGEVVCSVCFKRFRDNIAIEFYDGPIICSTECFKEASKETQ